MAEHSDSISPQSAEKNSEPSNTVTPSRTTLDYVRAVSPYLILLSFFGIGATIATVFWSSSYSTLQKDLRHGREELSTARVELEKVKSDLAKYQIGELPRTGSTTQVEIRITAGDTATVLGDDVRISLVGTVFESNPSRYKVNATVVSPGFEEMKIGNAEVGYTVSYSGKGTFDIEILAADTFSARFLLQRIGN